MTQPVPAAKSAEKSISPSRPAILASPPLIQLLAGIVAGAVVWTSINSSWFPRLHTELEISRQQAAEGVTPTEPPGRDADRQRGEGPGGGNGPGGAPDGGEAPQDPPAGDPPASGLPAADATSVAPTEPSSAPASDPVEAAGSAAPAADGCQPPADDETPGSASDEAAPTDGESVPAREDLSAEETPPAEVEAPTSTDDSSAPAADPEAAHRAAAAANPEDPEAALQEQRVQEMLERMEEQGVAPGMGAGMAMGGMGAGAPAMPPLTPAQREEARIVDTKNATIAIGFFGMLLCGLIGLVEGIWRKSLVAPLVGLLVGVFLGAVGGGLAGMAGKAIYYVDFKEVAHDFLQQNPKIADARPILEGMLMYGAMWAIVGVAAGLTMSLLTWRPRVVVRSVLGATLGGLLAGLAFATIEAVVFPLAAEGLVIPRVDPDLRGSLWIVGLPAGVNGWLWATIPAGMIALLGCWQGRVPPKTKAAFKIRNPATPA